jgi:hypothetical protein
MAIGICSHWTNRLKDPPGRDAWLIELEPKYCDTRYSQMAGLHGKSSHAGRRWPVVRGDHTRTHLGCGVNQKLPPGDRGY